MRCASLGSGSEGNGLLVEAREGASTTRILLDCGFTLKESERRLERLGVRPDSLSGIVVTHEHGDHISGVFKLARRHRIPVWATYGSLRGIDLREMEGVRVGHCRADAVFSVGALQILPYAVPHDAREPVQYVFSDGARRLGVLTDAGKSTARIVDALSRCHALVLECNHDRAMLAQSAYPQSLKLRISGAYGHLANDTAAEILRDVDRAHLQWVMAAHLSRQNNSPELARAALMQVDGLSDAAIAIADQEEGFGWREC